MADISPLLALLSSVQKQALKQILGQISARKKLNQKDIGFLGYDPHSSPPELTAKVLDVSRQTIYKWADEGCPRNADGSFSIPVVSKWLVQRIETKLAGKPGGSLKDDKTREEIERLRLANQKFKEEYIERSLMERIMTSRAASLNAFLTKSAIANTINYIGKNLEEIQAIRFAEAQAAMKAYVGNTD